ncbi:hypothetical protein RRG08_057626 [Elysia crispata]|uniref:Uncharacterized protein n=1 Tax=Elysia crispata TaxID=231223 RepID=A0AAE1A120_9GAST|nr:hypothetical protein RRG08_057626 [Elysia crispata]
MVPAAPGLGLLPLPPFTTMSRQVEESSVRFYVTRSWLGRQCDCLCVCVCYCLQASLFLQQQRCSERQADPALTTVRSAGSKHQTQSLP